MGPKERLVKYFSLARRQSTLTTDEYHEMVHLEEALIDDIDTLDLPDTLKNLQWQYIHESISLLCGPYAVLDTGSSWNVMEVLLEAFKKIPAKDRLKIADMAGGRVACGCDTAEIKRIKEQYKKVK